MANFKEANKLYLNDGKGQFTDIAKSAGVAGADSASFGTTFGDFDGDGNIDLYVSNSDVANVLYKNDGNGTFTDVTSSAKVGDTGNARGVSFVDIDGDGDLVSTQHSVKPTTNRFVVCCDVNNRTYMSSM